MPLAWLHPSASEDLEDVVERPVRQALADSDGDDPVDPVGLGALVSKSAIKRKYCRINRLPGSSFARISADPVRRYRYVI